MWKWKVEKFEGIFEGFGSDREREGVLYNFFNIQVEFTRGVQLRIYILGDFEGDAIKNFDGCKTEDFNFKIFLRECN